MNRTSATGAGVAVLAGMAVLMVGSGAAFAATGPAWVPGNGARGGATGAAMGRGPMAGEGVVGTVTAVNGTTLTVARGYFGPAAPGEGEATSSVSYTVDAAGATVMKGGSTSTVGAIAVGDKVAVRGAVNGTAVTATAIIDGIPGNMRESGVMRGMRPTGTMPAIQGNGEPVLGGTVTAVNGNMLTVTNAGNVTYSIDAASSTLVKGGATSSYGAIAVNDRLLVQGTVNGTSVTASSIIDQGPVPAAASSTATSSHPGGFFGGMARGMGGMFGGIGAFFHRMFGFF